MTAQDLLAIHSLVVVPTDSAAQQLRQAHDAQQRAVGRKAWSPANVLSWNQWLRSLWSQAVTEGLEDRLLLNAAQEHRLWHQLIQSHASSSGTLSSPEALADLAQQAWHVSGSYLATARLRQTASTHDARVFADWAEDFAVLCKEQGFVSHASLEAELASRVARHELQIPQQITLAGLLTRTPSQHLLLKAFVDAGTRLAEKTRTAASASSEKNFVLQADDEESELIAVASYVRWQLEEPATERAQVAVLVPDLDAVRPTIERVFREVLAPELQNVTEAEAIPPYEFTHSAPLASEPMLAAALDLVRWSLEPLSIEAVSALLLSRHIAPESSIERRASFDASRLRTAQRLRPEISLRSFVQEASRSEFADTLNWTQSLARFLENSSPLHLPRSFAQWTEFIRQLLRAAEWGSGSTPGTHEGAIERAWEHALDTVATLDFDGERVSLREALATLEQQLAGMRLSTSQRAPIQIMSPTEAVGMSFGTVIFVRATDANWPVLPQSNSLIAWQLQSSLGMPGSDRQTALAHARSELVALLEASGSVVFTYALSTGDGPQRLSPLIADRLLPIRTVADLALTNEMSPIIEPERLADEAPLPPLASSLVHGGAAVLQQQAACGFRAFAELRLRSTQLDSRDLGHDPRDRGTVLHEVMKSFWDTAKTQRALKAMTSGERQDLLTRCIEDAFSRSGQADPPWDAAYLSVQKERLRRVLTSWLKWELERTEFEVISSEQKKTVRVGPLELQLRVDRIDKVEDGEFLVDYKTGSSSTPANWIGERPDEPQLPLYALLAREKPLAGLAFAKVKPGKAMGWHGFAASDGVIPGRDIVRDMSTLQEEWQFQLDALAQGFADGDISVAPKTYPVTCNWCQQRLLCRLDASTLLDTEDPLEATEEELGV